MLPRVTHCLPVTSFRPDFGMRRLAAAKSYVIFHAIKTCIYRSSP
jgi:hypothetical protein